MGDLLKQVKDTVERCQASEEALVKVSARVTEVSQLAYTVNCIWLYARGAKPTKTDLEKALPPIVHNDPKEIEAGLEYIRKSFLVARSLLSEKITELEETRGEVLTATHAMAGFLSTPVKSHRIAEITEDDVEGIAEEVVPLVLKEEPDDGKVPKDPTALEKKRAKGAKVKASRPWMFT